MDKIAVKRSSGAHPLAAEALRVEATLYPAEPPAAKPAHGAISQETLRGGLYLAGRYGLGVLVSAGNMLVMTWWLGPHAYGLFVTAISLVAFLAVVSRGGIDTFLVRCEKAPQQGQYETASAIILAMSLAMMVLAALITPLLIRWYGSRDFVLPYLVLLVTIPTSGLTGVPMAKLERELDFRRIAAIELSGQVLGLIAAVALAWAKAGVWAPVAGQLVWQVFTLAATSRASRLKPRLRLHSEHWGSMCRFGVGMTLSLRTWQLRTLVNPILVGRLAGTEAVAFVALAIRIAEALGTFRLAAGRMAIAALARLQDRKDNFQSALKSALFLQVITLGPLLCAFALAGPFLLRHVIGPKWAPSLLIYPFIAAGVLVNSIFNLQASALFVLEQHWTVMRSYIAHVALLGGGTWLLFPRWGILGYGWAELVACLAYYLIHRRLRNEFRISIGNIALLAGAFTAVLFLPRFVALIFPHAFA